MQDEDLLCKEILPAIRKYGIYATPELIDKVLANPDAIIDVLNKIKGENSHE